MDNRLSYPDWMRYSYNGYNGDNGYDRRWRRDYFGKQRRDWYWENTNHSDRGYNIDDTIDETGTQVDDRDQNDRHYRSSVNGDDRDQNDRHYRSSVNGDDRDQNDRHYRSSVNGEKRRKSIPAVALHGCEKATNYSLGVFVRLLLIGGNVLAAWRTVIETDDPFQWVWVLVCVILMLIEYSITVFKKSGLEWTWWSPCFLVYISTTLPLVWQMQLRQRDVYLSTLNANIDGYGNGGGPQSIVDGAGTSFSTTTKATVQWSDVGIRTFLNINNDTWVIVVNESLVYLIIISRWLLPRGEISRDFLADMLLEFLAIASDIMELLALFDEGRVREDIMLNYWILTAWSVSFIQFIPVLLHKRKYRRIKNTSCLHKACGSNLTEVLSIIMTIILQDGSFLVLRLYIMLILNFVTYSLTFFVMKNLLSLLLQFYRLAIMVHNLPCCCGKKYQLSNSLRRTKTVSYDT